MEWTFHSVFMFDTTKYFMDEIKKFNDNNTLITKSNKMSIQK